jgi:hypothetical protein
VISYVGVQGQLNELVVEKTCEAMNLTIEDAAKAI